MKDFKILQLLDKLQFLFVKMGIDYDIMRKILHIKLTMDERKVPTLFNQNAKKKENQTYSYIKSLWIYVLMGLILIPFISFGTQFLFQMSIVYVMVMFIIMTSMISDFSSVLLDIRDRTILATKPIHTKTLNAAKFMHILIYLSFLTVAFTAIPLIVSLIRHGIFFFLLTILELIFINILIVVMTALLYMMVLRFFDGEKLKDMINYVQIGLSLMLMISYQFVIRSFEFVNLDVHVNFHWWSILLIPMWFAAPYELLFNGNYSFWAIILSSLAIIIPILSIWLYIKLIPTFERNLQKLLSTSKSKKEKTNRLRAFFLQLICPTHEERAFYRFASLMMKQEREFKLKVYPSLGFSFVIPFIFMLNTLRDEHVDFANSMSYLTIYFSMLIIPAAVLTLGHSSKYKAAWIYKVVPVTDYSLLIKGSLKAFLLKLYMPIFIILSIAFCFIYGPHIIVDLCIILVVGWLYAIIGYLCFGYTIPFSEPYDAMAQGKSTMTIALFLLLALLAGLHYVAATFIPYGSIILLFIIVMVNVIVWKKVFTRQPKYLQ
ncbi:hypothetical protein [Lysinibacillus piscis]|uniref:ABC transporter permease n=1 Tax=Lysinibacillus piscis TaxID=2518931 RepID=A0ABQ5NMJ2_9BACI|nr:hypothetical protein [Lysinibacillus sp. KH24]GLC89565.1 hypothetical protein LYSBPC_26920 [Lysinibacillus sp. KH24]